MSELFAEYETNRLYYTVSEHSVKADVLESVADKVIEFRRNYEVGTDVLSRIGGHSNTPESLVERLAELRDYSIASSIARRESISDKVFNLLINSGTMIAYHLACSNHLTKEREEILLTGDRRVRSRLAAYSKYPEIQLILARDKSSEVRQHLSSNRDISIETQEILMKDGNVEVRYTLANNPRINQDLLERMRDYDEHYEVKRAARNSLNHN